MKIEIVANVISQKIISGKNEKGEWDSSVFGGLSVNTLQFSTDKKGDIVCENLNLSCPSDVVEDDDTFSFEPFAPYRFTVEIIEYKQSVSKRIVSFERIVPTDKDTVVAFNTGKRL